MRDPLPIYPVSNPARFWSKVQKGDGCWLWAAARSASGYGTTSISGHNVSAHRVAYQLLVGPIPEGLTLDHLCRVRLCVNPAHLEPVTVRENTLRGDTFSGRNARKTHCPAGHPYDGPDTYRYGTRRRCRACVRARANPLGNVYHGAKTQCKNGHPFDAANTHRLERLSKDGTPYVERQCRACGRSAAARYVARRRAAA